MNTYRKYTTSNKERKVFSVVMLVILVIIIAWGVLELCGVFSQPDYYEPDIVHPIANAKVTWLETFHSGGWSEAE